jgi:hypothetical protein
MSLLLLLGRARRRRGCSCAEVLISLRFLGFGAGAETCIHHPVAIIGELCYGDMLQIMDSTIGHGPRGLVWHVGG